VKISKADETSRPQSYIEIFEIFYNLKKLEIFITKLESRPEPTYKY